MMLQTSLPSVVSNSLVNIERKSEQNGVTVKKTQDNKAAAYGRRSLCLGLTTCLSIALALQPAIAEEKVVENPYIQELLKKSKENKKKYDEERLRDYQKRAYGDYFTFYSGSIRKGKETENDKLILEWLSKNGQ